MSTRPIPGAAPAADRWAGPSRARPPAAAGEVPPRRATRAGTTSAALSTRPRHGKGPGRLTAREAARRSENRFRSVDRHRQEVPMDTNETHVPEAPEGTRRSFLRAG